MGTRNWFNLVPDRKHQVLTRGYGQFSEDDPIPDDTYATAAYTPDGTLAMAYLPDIRKVTIDMSKFSGPVMARWFDPTNDTYAVIEGSPFPNTGNRRFTPGGPNGAGDEDWVLLLEMQ
jgi:hypothetical protein